MLWFKRGRQVHWGAPLLYYFYGSGFRRRGCTPLSRSGLWKMVSTWVRLRSHIGLLWPLGGSRYMDDSVLLKSSWEPSAFCDCCLGGVYLHLQLACGQGQRLVPAECGSSAVWTIRQGQLCMRPVCCCALRPLVGCMPESCFTGGLLKDSRSICLPSCVLPLICCACAAASEAAYPSCTT